MLIAFGVRKGTWDVSKDLNQTQEITGGTQRGRVLKVKPKFTTQIPD